MPHAGRGGLSDRGEVAQVTSRAIVVMLASWALAAGSAAAQAAPGAEFPDEAEQPAPAEPGAELPDAADEPAEPTTAIALALSVGFPTDETLDEALSGLGYGGTVAVPGGDVTVLFALARWFWIGGRVLTRGRDWPRPDAPSASAVGVGALVTGELRLHVNRAALVALVAAAGGGGIGFRLGESTETGVGPAAFLGVTLASAVGEHAALFARLGYEYFEANDIGGSGYDLNLSGGVIAIGAEIRP